MKKYIALFLVLIISVSLVACGGNPTTDSTETTVDPILQAQDKLVEAYNIYCKNLPKKNVTLASDNMSITMDTDMHGYSYYDTTVVKEAIPKINKHLGFSSSLWDKMQSTRAIDGMQKESSKEYTVTWTYHPDTGFRVIYEVNRQ